jgi:hypothetical protein
MKTSNKEENQFDSVLVATGISDGANGDAVGSDCSIALEYYGGFAKKSTVNG